MDRSDFYAAFMLLFLFSCQSTTFVGGSESSTPQATGDTTISDRSPCEGSDKKKIQWQDSKRDKCYSQNGGIVTSEFIDEDCVTFTPMPANTCDWKGIENKIASNDLELPEWYVGNEKLPWAEVMNQTTPVSCVSQKFSRGGEIFLFQAIENVELEEDECGQKIAPDNTYIATFCYQINISSEEFDSVEAVIVDCIERLDSK